MYIAGIALFITAIALVFVLSLYQDKIEADEQIAAQKMNNIEAEVIESTTSSNDKGINEVSSKENIIDVQNVEKDSKKEEKSVDNKEDEKEDANKEQKEKNDKILGYITNISSSTIAKRASR